MEFRSDGSALGILYSNGQKEVTQSLVRVEDKTVFLTISSDQPGRVDTTKHAILKLTRDELIFRDEDRSTYPLTRLRD